MLEVGIKQGAHNDFVKIVHFKVYVRPRLRESFSLPVWSHHATGSCRDHTVAWSSCCMLFCQDHCHRGETTLRNVDFFFSALFQWENVFRRFASSFPKKRPWRFVEFYFVSKSTKKKARLWWMARLAGRLLIIQVFFPIRKMTPKTVPQHVIRHRCWSLFIPTCNHFFLCDGLQVMVKWYNIYNAPGGPSAHAEWSLFVTCLMTLMGYNTERLAWTRNVSELLMDFWRSSNRCRSR